MGVLPFVTDIGAELEGTGICTRHTGCKVRWGLEAHKESKMRQAALCLADTVYTDKGLFLYLNIVACLGVIIGPRLSLSLDI